MNEVADEGGQLERRDVKPVPVVFEAAAPSGDVAAGAALVDLALNIAVDGIDRAAHFRARGRAVHRVSERLVHTLQIVVASTQYRAVTRPARTHPEENRYPAGRLPLCASCSSRTG